MSSFPWFRISTLIPVCLTAFLGGHVVASVQADGQLRLLAGSKAKPIRHLSPRAFRVAGRAAGVNDLRPPAMGPELLLLVAGNELPIGTERESIPSTAANSPVPGDSPAAENEFPVRADLTSVLASDVAPPVSTSTVVYNEPPISTKSELMLAPDLTSATTKSIPAGSELPAITKPNRDIPTDLSLTVGKSVIVDTELPIERIALGIGDIAEGTAVSPHEVLVNGKTPGATSLIIWQRGGPKRFFDVRVAASTFVADNRVDAIRREIERELPGQAVSLSFENESAFLRGSVKDVTSAERAVAIASTLGKTVNLLYVDVPSAEAQILLKVKFASVDRSISTQLGMNILSTGAANTVGSTSTKEFAPPAAPAVTGNSPIASTIADALNLFFFRTDLNLGATIQALQVRGLLQVLSEPNVLAQNGKQSSFLAGGEFPFPSVSSGGAGGTPAVSIQFREYGVRLTFTPTITPRGTIQLQVAPEVSALDFTNGLSVSGFNVPALTTRKLNTQVELSQGQSFAIGGLLDNRTTDTFEKIPFIGDIPILGKFFQSKSVSKQNTELIVIVTPELVQPIPVGQSLPSLKFTKPFMAPNTDYAPQTPGRDATGPLPAEPRPATIPIEKLLQSLEQVAAPGAVAQPRSASAAPPAAAPATAQ